MEATFIYELIGYVASILVAVSLMMSNIVQLRIVNMIGAATFSIYGILIGSIPVAAMNGFIVLINIYYLMQIYSTVEYFQILKVSGGSEYLETFLNFYQDQISTFQPNFNYGFREDGMNIFVLRDMIPAGLLVGNLKNDGTFVVELDFVVPQYRDFKIGNFLFKENKNFFRDRQIKKIVSKPGSMKHSQYLEEVGFKKENGGDGNYYLQL